MENKLEIYIEVRVSTNDQIKAMVKLASEIQKEYICHCTLSVKKLIELKGEWKCT